MDKRITLVIVIYITILVVSFIAIAEKSNAASYSTSSHHDYGKAQNYNCALVSKPQKPDWVWYRYPTKKSQKRDAYNNGKVKLIWEDSFRAHKVEYRYRIVGTKKWKTKETDDDGSQTVKNLINGKLYEFEVRGVSNCGKSEWGKTPKNNGIRQYIKP